MGSRPGRACRGWCGAWQGDDCCSGRGHAGGDTVAAAGATGAQAQGRQAVLGSAGSGACGARPWKAGGGPFASGEGDREHAFCVTRGTGTCAFFSVDFTARAAHGLPQGCLRYHSPQVCLGAGAPGQKRGSALSRTALAPWPGRGDNLAGGRQGRTDIGEHCGAQRARTAPKDMSAGALRGRAVGAALGWSELMYGIYLLGSYGWGGCCTCHMLFANLVLFILFSRAFTGVVQSCLWAQ